MKNFSRKPLQDLAPLDCFQRCQAKRWLWGISQDDWVQDVAVGLENLQGWITKMKGRPRVLIRAAEPEVFLSAYMACAIAEVPMLLANPDWRASELEKAFAIAQPNLLWDSQGVREVSGQDLDPTQTEWIMIPTGGSGGQIKFAIHTWQTLTAAIQGMQSFFFEEDQPISSCCVLPLHHVSGLMQFMRSLVTGGELRIIPFKAFLQGDEQDDFLGVDSLLPQNFFLSLVPTQLTRFLERNPDNRVDWLKQFQCILLGGAPASTTLLDQSRRLGLRLAPTYGMTETAAQVMTLPPDDFLAGRKPPGEILPHVKLTLLDQDAGVGVMQWEGQSIFHGYFPNYSSQRSFRTDDLARSLSDGTLELIGRSSRKIISGGENIYPEEIEAAVLAMKLVDDIWVFGVPDADWGEIAIAAYVSSQELKGDDLSTALKQRLASFKCPKAWMPLDEIPRNAQGKVLSHLIVEAWARKGIAAL